MGIVVAVLAKCVAWGRGEESMVMLTVVVGCMLLEGNVDERASSSIGSDAKSPSERWKKTVMYAKGYW